MPAPWSSLTPLLTFKRAFSSNRSDKKKKQKEDIEGKSSPISSLYPCVVTTATATASSSASLQPRFSRRDEQLRTTRKYMQQQHQHPTGCRTQQQGTSIPRASAVAAARRSPSPSVLRRRVMAPTQQWPSASTLLAWMEPSLRVETTTVTGRTSASVTLPALTRARRYSEGALTPSKSSFYSDDSIPLPTRRPSDRRGTTEKVAAWIRSRSRERLNEGERPTIGSTASFHRDEDETDEQKWQRTTSERWKKRLPPIPSRSRSIDSNLCALSSMVASATCSNCMTKYTLLNRENGCSTCSLSFCNKCVQWRAVLPASGQIPVPVCHRCFDRLEARQSLPSVYPSIGTRSPLPHPQPTVSFSTRPSVAVHQPQAREPPSAYAPAAPQSHHPMHLTQPWWTNGELPPPSMRQEYGKGIVQPRPLTRSILTSDPYKPPTAAAAMRPPSSRATSPQKDELIEMELRAKRLKDNAQGPPPSLSSLEERLAALRGVDVELVRNPRMWFERGSAANDADTVDQLMKEARSRAILEEWNDPDKLLKERAKRLMEKKEDKKDDMLEKIVDKKTDEDEARLSEVPSTGNRLSDFSEATKEELADIERVMAEAKKRVEEADGSVRRVEGEDEGKKKEVTSEMGEANKLAAQLSLDVEKVNSKMAAFWKRENNKRRKVDEDSSSEEEMDEETFAKIVKEAEMIPDEPMALTSKAESSPDKKKGFFGRMFKK